MVEARAAEERPAQVENAILDYAELGEEPPVLVREGYVGLGNNPKLARDALRLRGYSLMAKADRFRFKWVQTATEVNFAKFIEGQHIVNHISNSHVFTSKLACLDMLADLNRSLQNGNIQSKIYSTTNDFLMPTYRLDSVDGLATFLKTDNNSLWLIKSTSTANNRPI